MHPRVRRPASPAASGHQLLGAAPPADASAIRLRGVGVRYPGAVELALRDVSIDLRAGESVVLAGATGSGKSTLLRVLTGVVPHLSGGRLTGTVSVLGLDASVVPPHVLAAHGVALVAQDPSETFVSDQVGAEVAFGPESLALPEAEVDDLVGEALAAVGLAGAGRRRVRRLSGGEQQRVAIAAALALRPRVLLLDEPTAHLDDATARQILELVAAVARERGMTVVLAEHRLGIAAWLASRAFVLAGGAVVRDGAPRDVLAERAVAELGVPVPRAAVAALALGLTPPIPLSAAELAPRLSAVAPSSVAVPPAAAAGDEVLRFAGVTYAYPGTERPAVRDVSFAVRSGERVALVGPTGSGKSTLARLSLGLRRPDGGAVAVAGMRTSSTPMARLARSGGLVLQDPVRQLIAERVRDEIALGLAHLPDAERRERTDREMERFGLTELRDRHPLTLSEGQRRRVVLASATARAPRVLVLDEPTLGQDGRQRDALAGLVRELAKGGTAVLVISHDAEFVWDACERALVLSDGMLAGDVALRGDPETIETAAAAGVPLADVPAAVLLMGRQGRRVIAVSVAELVACARPLAPVA